MRALVITPVLCQPLDKAVYCNLQVSMTLTMEPSDKAAYCKLWVSIHLKKKIKQVASGIHTSILGSKTNQRKWSPSPVAFYTPPKLNQPVELSTSPEPDFTINTPLIPWMNGSLAVSSPGKWHQLNQTSKKTNQMEMITIGGPSTPTANNLDQGIPFYSLCYQWINAHYLIDEIKLYTIKLCFIY